MLLFRISALIFVGYRVHDDIDRTRDVEGYPGLVVHGPLIATRLVDLGVDHMRGRVLRSFDIRAMQPLFASVPFTITGRTTDTGATLWARARDGTIAMAGTLHPAD